MVVIAAYQCDNKNQKWMKRANWMRSWKLKSSSTLRTGNRRRRFHHWIRTPTSTSGSDYIWLFISRASSPTQAAAAADATINSSYSSYVYTPSSHATVIACKTVFRHQNSSQERRGRRKISNSTTVEARNQRRSWWIGTGFHSRCSERSTLRLGSPMMQRWHKRTPIPIAWDGAEDPPLGVLPFWGQSPPIGEWQENAASRIPPAPIHRQRHPLRAPPFLVTSHSGAVSVGGRPGARKHARFGGRGSSGVLHLQQLYHHRMVNSFRSATQAIQYWRTSKNSQLCIPDVVTYLNERERKMFQMVQWLVFPFFCNYISLNS